MSRLHPTPSSCRLLLLLSHPLITHLAPNLRLPLCLRTTQLTTTIITITTITTIFLSPPPSPPSPQPTTTTARYDRSIHMPVILTCDCCGLYFRGTRFSCPKCKEVDVCEMCCESSLSAAPIFFERCAHSNVVQSLQTFLRRFTHGYPVLS